MSCGVVAGIWVTTETVEAARCGGKNEGFVGAWTGANNAYA